MLRIICHLPDSVYNSKCLGALVVDILVLGFNPSSVTPTRVILDSVNFLIHTMGIVVFYPTRQLWGLNEWMHIKHLVLNLANDSTGVVIVGIFWFRTISFYHGMMKYHLRFAKGWRNYLISKQWYHW